MCFAYNLKTKTYKKYLISVDQILSIIKKFFQAAVLKD
jgi:hypothetical protein